MADKVLDDTLIDLLNSTRAVKREEIDEAQKTAKKLGVSLERSLIMLNFISHESLQPISETAHLIKLGHLNKQQAQEVIKLVRSQNESLDYALQIVQQNPEFQTKATDNDETQIPQTIFVEFLLKSNLINKEQLQVVYKKSLANQIHLSRALILDRYLTKQTITIFFSLLQLRKELNLNDDLIFKCLKTAHARQINPEQILFEQGIKFLNTGTSLKLSELIALSKLVSDTELIECFELELSEGTSIANILVKNNLLTPDVIEAAHSLLDMVASPTIRGYHASSALRQIKNKGISVFQALAELNPNPQLDSPPLSLFELLENCKIVPKDKLLSVNGSNEDTGIQLSKKLLAKQLINELELNISLRTYSLHKEGIINQADAMALLNLANSKKIAFDEAVSRLSLQVPARMQWNWN